MTANKFILNPDSFILNDIIGQVADHVMITDKQGTIVYVNTAFEKTTGYSKKEVLGKSPKILQSGKMTKKYYQELWGTILAGKVCEAKPINKKKNGQFYVSHQTISPILDKHGEIIYFVSIWQDITETVELENKLESEYLRTKRLYAELEKKNKENEIMIQKLDELTLTDPLTGALNRRGLQRALSREVAWVNRYGTSLLAILLDLDNFKKINDTQGHVAGDEILKAIVRNLRDTLRSVDYVARVGGDEFIILLAHTRLGDGFGLAEKIRYTVAETRCIFNDLTVQATASLGLAQVTDECSTVEDLVRKCQFVLKNSKNLGKNRVSYADSSGDIKQGELDKILKAMNQKESYRVVKQPIYSLADMSLWGYEFLTRMNVQMFEMPGDFFHLSRANNILTMVDLNCLHHCAQKAEAVGRGLRKHVNLYPTTIIESPIENIIKEFPLEGREDFCVELSEHLIKTDFTKLLEFITLLKKHRIHIAIDDVGFGNSSLESLVLLEPDIIKIDKKINVGLAKDNGRQRSLERLLKISESLNAQVIVEGIESEDDLKMLCSMGVSLGQGFLIGRPE